MNITITNRELLELYQGLNKFKQSQISLPVKIMYAIVKNSKAISAALEPYNAVSQEVIAKYEDPNANIPAIEKELAPILAQTETIELQTFSVSEIEQHHVSMEVMTALMFMLD